MTEAWQRAKKILAVRLDAMGDVLMTEPALRALHAEGSSRRLTLLTSPSGAAAAKLIGAVDDVMVFDAPWMKVSPEQVAPRIVEALVDRLRDENFDAAVIFTVYSQSPLPAAFACYVAGIPLRLAHCRENPYHLLTHWVREPEPQALVRHEVRRQVELVATTGFAVDDDRLRIDIPPAAEDQAQRIINQLGLVGNRRWAVVHPGATAPARRYPPDLFARAADRLCRDHGIVLVFSGDVGEKDHVEEVRRRMTMPSETLVGRLELPVFAAMLRRAPLLIANNTGPVHLAAAVGAPVVDLYALTNPQHTPWRTPNIVLNHDVPCRNCYQSDCPMGHHDCLAKVSPDKVVAAACSLLDGALSICAAKELVPCIP